MWWNKYIGMEFEDRGLGPRSFNCWGFLRWVYLHDRFIKDALGAPVVSRVELPTYDWVYDNTNEHLKISKMIALETEAGKRWVEKSLAEIRDFDVLLLRARGVPMHVGIFTKPGWMVHCEHGVGVVHERYDSLRWKHRIMGVYRYE